MSLDFGRLKTADFRGWRAVLSLLETAEREYVEVMPWEKNISNAYHLIDDRMFRILCQLEGSGYLPGVYYFAS